MGPAWNRGRGTEREEDGGSGDALFRSPVRRWCPAALTTTAGVAPSWAASTSKASAAFGGRMQGQAPAVLGLGQGRRVKESRKELVLEPPSLAGRAPVAAMAGYL